MPQDQDCAGEGEWALHQSHHQSASLKIMEQETGAKTISCAKVFLGMFMNTVQVHAI